MPDLADYWTGTPASDRLVAATRAMPNQTGGGQLDLAAIRARADAATPGPWTVGRTTELDWGANPPGRIGDRIVDSDGVWPRTRTVEGTHVAAVGEMKRMVADMSSRGYRNSRFAADAEFIAAARTDVPALLDEVERLRDGLAARDRAGVELVGHLAAAVAERDAYQAVVDAARNYLACAASTASSSAAFTELFAAVDALPEAGRG
jgi:hypothetical protein